MKILGIDPGLRITGYGILEYDKKSVRLVETGTINPKQNALFQNRLDKIFTLVDELIKEHQPQVMVLEKLYAHHNHPTTASILGHARGVICLAASKNSIELVEHSVKRIRKAVTGNGSATKQQTRRNVANKFSIKESKLTLDASDAIALALGYVYMSEPNSIMV